MNTQYRKNLKAVLEASKSYTDNKIEDLRWELGTYDLSVDNDNTTAYQKIVPSGSIQAKINKLGGMSYKYNQLVKELNSTNWATANSSVSYDNGVATMTATAQYGRISQGNVQVVQNNKYLFVANVKLTTATTSIYFTINRTSNITLAYTTATTNWQQIAVIFTQSQDSGNASLSFGDSRTSDWDSVQVKDIQLFNLTAMFGAGNEPSDVSTATSELLKRGIDITTYTEYNLGTIRDSAVSSVVSKDSNNITLDTLTIAAEIQALTGYGWGVNDTCYNYIDYESKKFIQKVGRVDLGSLDWLYNSSRNCFQCTEPFNYKYSENVAALSDLYNYIGTIAAGDDITSESNLSLALYYKDGWSTRYIYIKNTSYTDATTFKTAMSGVYLYYELATPIETNISSYIDDGYIEVEENGSLTFNNTYNQAVPSDIDYLIEEVKA